MAQQAEWNEFFSQAQQCKACATEGMVNVLEGLSPQDPWGLAWYDKHRNLDGGLMMVGMDFGNEDTAAGQRSQIAIDPNFEPGFKGGFRDRSYARLRNFLHDSGLADKVFVTNAALCVRPKGVSEEKPYSGRVYRNCARLLRAQINVAKPNIIVALGGDALDYVCDALRVSRYKEGIMEYVGKPRPVKVNEATLLLIPFLHPRQGQKGWTDPRQLDELFIPLASRLEACQRQQSRAEYRVLFREIV